MPSHADRVRRHYAEDPPRSEPGPVALRAGLAGPLSQLERYAGWLARNQVSAAVRAGIVTLHAAVEAGDDPPRLLMLGLELDHDIKRLPGGAIPKMLRKASAEIRAALDPGAADARRGEGA